MQAASRFHQSQNFNLARCRYLYLLDLAPWCPWFHRLIVLTGALTQGAGGAPDEVPKTSHFAKCLLLSSAPRKAPVSPPDHRGCVENTRRQDCVPNVGGGCVAGGVAASG
jgi:hypothetical protein